MENVWILVACIVMFLLARKLNSTIFASTVFTGYLACVMYAVSRPQVVTDLYSSVMTGFQPSSSLGGAA